MRNVRFESAADLLSYLSAEKARPFAKAPPKAEVAALLAARTAELDAASQALLTQAADSGNPYDFALQDDWQVLKRELDLPLADALDNRFACGVVDHMAANAVCVRSPKERFYVILVHHGLVHLMHKHLKLQVAEMDPSTVTYCSEMPATALSPSAAAGMRQELEKHYERTQEVLPIQVVLTVAAMERIGPLHLMWRLFVLAHEVGHIRAGHFADQAQWDAREFGLVETFVEGRTIDEEHQADLHAYWLLRGAVARMGILGPSEGIKLDRFLWQGVEGFFHMLGAVGIAGSRSHPGPTSRIRYLASHVYGPEVLRLIDERNELAALAASLPAGGQRSDALARMQRLLQSQAGLLIPIGETPEVAKSVAESLS